MTPASRITARYMTARLRRMNLLSTAPPLGTQRALPERERMIHALVYEPYGPGQWLVADFDGEDVFWGAAKQGSGWRWGMFSLKKLEGALGRLDPRVEFDTNFRPKLFPDAVRGL